MNGGQMMVVCIVALVMLTSLIKASMRNGDDSGACSSKRRRRNKEDGTRDEILVKMNEQLDRITSRLTALETIVTDEDRELKREFSSLRSDVSNARKSVDAERY